MLTTSNHGLRKPEYSDNADIADINYNTDKIDNMPVLYRQSTEPTNKVSGKTLWYDTANGVLKMWNGSSWDAVAGSCTLLLSDSELEAKFASDSIWCSKFFKSRLAVPLLFDEKHIDYWFSVIEPEDIAISKLVESGIAMPYVAKLADWMSAITSSYVRKNWVACSQPAMESIFKETVGRTIMLYDDYIGVVWINENSEEVWKGGSPAVPHTYDDYVSSSIIDGYTYGGKGFQIYKADYGPLSYYAWTVDIDLTDVSLFEIYTRKSGYSGRNYLQIKIDGTSVYRSYSNHDWTKRSFDVSSLTGVKAIEVALETTDNATPYSYVQFSDICLVKAS